MDPRAPRPSPSQAMRAHAQLKHEQQAEQQARQPPVFPGNEQQAYKQLLVQAKRAGAWLHGDGKGGLPSSFVLGVMKRDGFRCKRCGGADDLTIHHKGGIVESEWLSKKGHQNVANNFATLCTPCHNAMHEQAKAEGTDASQVLPEGDEGTKRDRGQPPAPF